MIERFGADWGLNARGIYYRHHYSPGWVSFGHNLWMPSLDGIDWKHFSESSRCSRAETFLKHVLNNERWKKSEYAWEADAWADVFGQREMIQCWPCKLLLHAAALVSNFMSLEINTNTIQLR